MGLILRGAAPGPPIRQGLGIVEVLSHLTLVYYWGHHLLVPECVQLHNTITYIELKIKM